MVSLNDVKATTSRSANMIALGNLDDERIVVVVAVDGRLWAFFFQRKPSRDGWYIVSVAEARTDTDKWYVSEKIQRMCRPISLCDDDNAQEEMLGRLGIEIEGHLVEEQFA